MISNRFTRRRVLRAGILSGAGLAALYAIACGGGTSDDAGSTGTSGGSSSSTGGGDGRGGTLRIAMTASNIPIPNTPVTEGGEGTRFVGRQVYATLIHEDVYSKDWPQLKPGLAESWTLSDDQLTWTFKLKSGLNFHDGSPFSAESVVFQWDRLTNKDFEFYDSVQGPLSSTYTRTIESMKAVDPTTLEVKTKYPNSFLFYDLISMFLPSPEVIKKYGNKDYAKYASGLGPYKITKYVDGQVMELANFEGYYRGRPKLDKLVLLPMAEPATRVAALQAGDVDWAEAPPPDAINQLKGNGFQIVTGPYPHVNNYFLNLLEPPFNDLRVRQAVNYLVDREGTVKLINGIATPALQFVNKEHPWYDHTFEGYTYDPQKAKQLLEAAGIRPGYKINMLYPSGGSGNMFPGPMNEKLQQDFRAVGLNLEMTPTEWETVRTNRQKGFAAPEMKGYHILHNSLGSTNPSTTFLAFLSEGTPPTGRTNPGPYKNPRLDELYAKAMTVFDTTEQNKLLAAAQGLAMRDAAVMVTVHDLNARAFSPKFKGFISPQSWSVDLTQVWMQ